MIYIRADANPNIGMGHIMRCLSIADAFHSAGLDLTFILADDGVKPLVISRGYQVIILHSDYEHMEAELPLWESQTIKSTDYIIIDSYFISDRYLNELKCKVTNGKLIYIDDLATFPYPVDILVNYNAYGTDLDYVLFYVTANVDIPQLILGPSYAPLRSMFRGLSKKVQPERVENVLISTGGSDLLHLALSIVKSKPENYIYHVLIGALNSDKEEIKRLAGENIVLHENVADMKALIESVDIVVSAAGSTLYEICASGVPLITYVLADNQMLGAEAFGKLGLAVNLGDMRTEKQRAEKIFTAIKELDKNYERRCSIGIRMQEMIDGFGADRMVKEIWHRKI